MCTQGIFFSRRGVHLHLKNAINKKWTQTGLNFFFRKIKLKEFFHDNNSEQDDSLVRNKNNFEPTKGRIAALDDFITRTKDFPLSNLPTNKKHKITLDERKALDSLKMILTQ